MSERKPKFKVGQVVRVKCTGFIIQLYDRNLQCKRWYYWEKDKSTGFDERDIRPLTKTEAGR